MSIVCLIRNARLAVPAAVAIGLLSGCGDDNTDVATTTTPSTPTAPAFKFVEATISDTQKAIASGSTTCHDVVQGYINRINTYDFDTSGLQLRSVIRVSTTALAEADRQDAQYKATGTMSPLFCVPVLPKDNFDTFDMPTTAGATALATSQPPDDAFTIARLRAAGAIIIGKANLDEFAFGFQGSGSIRGQTANAYDPTKGPGGSSAGTGSAIAASLALVGMGTDTGGSVRVPSSLEGLVGIRPSLRLLSQDGIIPLAHFQDTAGPMCRTVQDCALMMDALVGYDPSAGSNQRLTIDRKAVLVRNAEEYQRVTKVPKTYTAFLDAGALKGAHIGVVRAMFGDGTGDNAQVQATMNAAIAQMQAAGATVEDVTIPDLGTILNTYISVSRFEFKNNLTDYLSSWSSAADGHPASFDAVMGSGGYEARNASTFTSYSVYGTNPESNATYIANTDARDAFVRARLTMALDNVDTNGNSLGQPYDVLIYPELLGLAPAIGSQPNSGTNNRLSPFSGFPALVMPAGMASTTPALPVGMEMLGREFDEPTLIRLAYAFQQVAKPRQAPTFEPELVTKK